MYEKQGDLLQILGGGITIVTQVIGNVMQVLADTVTEEGRRVNAVGAWIQAIGEVVTALAILR